VVISVSYDYLSFLCLLGPPYADDIRRMGMLAQSSGVWELGSYNALWTTDRSTTDLPTL
jgi:hypothetical protein